MKRRKFFIAGVVICLALGFLGYVGYTLMDSSLDYYSTVSGLVEKGESVYGQVVQVNGYVVPGSVQSDTENGILVFKITDHSENLDVSYEGTSPDNFGDDIQVVLKGKLYSTEIFHATSISTKCPSKYEAED